MKGNIGVILILVLTVVLLYVVGFFSVNDQVTEVLDVNTFQLSRGRVVHLIGIASSAVEVQQEVSAEDEIDSLDSDSLTLSEPVYMLDTLAIDMIRRQVGGMDVVLEYSNAFQPDTASPDLHAYMRLQDGTDVGAMILSKGLAKVNTIHTHPREVEYASYQAEAKLARLGIWASEVDTAAVQEIIPELEAETAE